jgi:methyltransferase (TIGR00027 family)
VANHSSSRTALFIAAYRARASARQDALFDDPWSAKLAGDDGFELARRYDAVYPYGELWTTVRTAFIDARVRRALGSPWNMRQVVILGAGFDTRAARLAAKEARFFEVDRAETQAEKVRRVSAIEGYPREHATYVPCDFEHQDFLVELEHAGFRSDVAAMFVWEGVTPYLTEGAVRATLRRLAQGTAPGSVVVFDHVRKRLVSGSVQPDDLGTRELLGDLGEPLRWGCDDVLPVLYAEGFRRVRTTSFDEACLDLTGTYERERKFRFQSLAVASRGAPELP